MRILLLGATGMLGSQFLRQAIQRTENISIIARNEQLIQKYYPLLPAKSVFLIKDIKDFQRLEFLIKQIEPDVIVNSIGIVKQSNLAKNAFESVAVNSYLPHLLGEFAKQNHCRLIHISTDCVFDGQKGNYTEDDQSNAIDLYGKSKYLGEVSSENSVTLRTSIIGHELTSSTFGLLEWFLKEKDNVKGFTKAIFSGVTTNELSRIILDFVIPQNLTGQVYNVAADPISKYDLLKIIGNEYQKSTQIYPSEELVIDRSLNGMKFQNKTGYKPPQWPEMIKKMLNDFLTTTTF